MENKTWTDVWRGHGSESLFSFPTSGSSGISPTSGAARTIFVTSKIFPILMNNRTLKVGSMAVSLFDLFFSSLFYDWMVHWHGKLSLNSTQKNFKLMENDYIHV